MTSKQADQILADITNGKDVQRLAASMAVQAQKEFSKTHGASLKRDV